MTLPPQSSRTSAEDLRVASAALGGDPEARARIAERLECVHGILASKNASLGRPLGSDELADLTQDTLAKIWKKLPSYAGRASLATWSWRFCTLELMNAMRKKSRQPKSLSDLELEPAGAAPRESTDESESPTLKLLRHLPPREAEVIRLRHIDQLESMDEIAKALGISVSSVKTHYYRGLDKLRGMLRQSPPDSADTASGDAEQ